MSIFREIYQSVYGPSYYEEVLKQKLSRSFVYFISFSLIASLVFSGILSFRALPFLRNALDSVGPEILSRFPENLVLTIRDGQLSANLPSPVQIPLFTSSSTLLEEKLPRNVLVIDTQNPFDETSLRKASTLFYLTQDRIYSLDKYGNLQGSEALKDIPDMTIDRTRLLDWLSELRPFLPWVPFLVVLGFFLFCLWLSLLALLGLVLGSFLIMLVAKIRGRPLGYKQAYQVGLHAVTSSILLLLFFSLTPFLLLSPLILLLALLIAVWVNLSPRSENNVSSIQ